MRCRALATALGCMPSLAPLADVPRRAGGRRGGLDGAMTPRRRIFQWADERATHQMVTPAQLEACGWRRVCPHPRYPSSWLMERAW